MKALSIGSSNFEITCPVNVEIKEGLDLKLNEKYECGSGRAGNAAYLLGKWGCESYVASMLGSDDYASRIKKEYETIGVKTDYIETAYDKNTSLKVITLNTVNKIGTEINVDSGNYLKKFNALNEMDLLILDGYDREASLNALDKLKALTVFSPSYYNDATIELAKLSGYVIFKQTIAEQISNIKANFEDSSSLVNLFNNLKQRFNNSEIIVTFGEKGVVYSINGQVKIMPPVRVEVQDTNGAGDIFAGAFGYSMAMNFGFEKSIAYASIASSLSTTKITSRLSVPSLNEVSTYYDNKFGKENNPNNNQNANA